MSGTAGAAAWTTRCTGLAVGAGLGLAAAALLWADDLHEVWRLHEALAQMQAEHQRVAVSLEASEALPGAGAAVPAEPPGPTVGERDAAWLWLQQGLQAQGLRVEALRPEPVQTGSGLVSQVAQLRLSGAWADWVAFGQHMAARAPWWVCEQWQVLPSGSAGQVQVEARWRLWLHPDPVPARPQPDWPVWTVVPTRPALPLFAAVPAATAEPLAPAQAQASAPSPAWRLWGVWTQAGQSQVVLGRGTEWTVLSPGQTWGAGAYRLERMDAAGAHLTGARDERPLFLPWEGTP